MQFVKLTGLYRIADMLCAKVFIEAYPEPTRQLNYKKLNLQRFDPGALVRCDGAFHLVSDPIRRLE